MVCVSVVLALKTSFEVWHVLQLISWHMVVAVEGTESPGLHKGTGAGGLVSRITLLLGLGFKKLGVAVISDAAAVEADVKTTSPGGRWPRQARKSVSRHSARS
uniref:Uncharacterized protein n=1 Tax=Eutreptiella gymnastica TaxID=73025 RepID=A0A7S4GIF1_9EUGL|mmetsp:Transcript_10604/g.18141  ORF Transcript_10604/g.18141 Transcript_10604/m.18141 type:complete len:103 (+) Transcript_10604:67-375(+)